VETASEPGLRGELAEQALGNREERENSPAVWSEATKKEAPHFCGAWERTNSTYPP